jgi:hypothetical protein
MGRGPKEDHEEEEHRGERDSPARRGPGDDRPHGAGGASDDDVVDRPGLEPERVEESVEHDRAEREPRTQGIPHPPEQEDRRGPHADREAERAALGDASQGQRAPLPGARHRRVQIALEVLIERVGRAGGQRDREQHEREPGRIA